MGAVSGGLGYGLSDSYALGVDKTIAKYGEWTNRLERAAKAIGVADGDYTVMINQVNPVKDDLSKVIFDKETMTPGNSNYDPSTNTVTLNRVDFIDKQNVVVGIYNYDADGKYATIGIEGFADEYVVTEELKKTLYLNFERNLKRKEIKKKTNTDRIDLSKISVSTPSEGFGIVFENDSIVAVSPQIVGDFDLSDSFVRNFNSCVNRFNIHF